MESYAHFSGTNDFTTSVSKYYYQIEVTLPDNSAPEVSVNHSPLEPTNMDSITFTIFVDDDSGNDGFQDVRLIVDGDIVETWNTLGTHEITLGSFVEGEHTYYVIAEDKQGNWNSDPQEGTKTFFVTTELEKTSTILFLDEPVNQVNEGDSVSFSGRLTEIDGTPISNAYISIFDFDGINFQDDHLISVYTDSDGYFIIIWDAICTDSHQNPCMMEVYGVFTGSADFLQSKSPINYYELEITVTTLSISGQVFCSGDGGSPCLNGNIDEPIPYVKVVLYWTNGNNDNSDFTYTNSDGRYYFENLLISNDGLLNFYTIHVVMTDDKFVNIVDARSAESLTYYFESPILTDLTLEGLTEETLNNLDVKINEKDGRDAATIYTYVRKMADYFVHDLNNEVLNDMGTLDVRIFGSGGSYWRHPIYNEFLYDFQNCFGCHVNMNTGHMPSTASFWKDVVGMEYFHAIHSANDGYGGPGYMASWWAENFGTFGPEALQIIFNDVSGVDGHANTWCSNGNEENITYRDPENADDTFAIYCPAASILWDFFDTAIMNNLDEDDDNVSLSFKTLWDALGSVRVNSLKDLYDILLTLDVNNDGINDVTDHNLVNEIFDMHGAPGGFELN